MKPTAAMIANEFRRLMKCLVLVEISGAFKSFMATFKVTFIRTNLSVPRRLMISQLTRVLKLLFAEPTLKKLRVVLSLVFAH